MTTISPTKRTPGSKGTSLLPDRSVSAPVPVSINFRDKLKNVPLGATFPSVLAKDNVTLQYSGNERLANGQKTNFAPRVGFAYQALPTTVVRGGFGIFYGGLMAEGNTNLGANFPFSNSANFYRPDLLYEQLPLSSPPRA